MPFSSRSAVSAAILAAACAVTSLAQGQERYPAPPIQGPPAAAPFDNYYPAEDGGVQLAALLQQPGEAATGAEQPAPRRYATGGRQSGNRLASVPHMFGDLALATTTFRFTDVSVTNQVVNGTAQIPLGGGTRSGKLAENDIALPMDRIFFSYNHFENVFTVSEMLPFPPPNSIARFQSIDRYTLGAEKTFLDGWTSIEIRMPFNGTFDANLTTAGVNGGNVGNLTTILKALLYQDDALGIGGGLAVEAPTASDIESRVGPANIRFLNQAVHLLPFLGFLYAPGDPTWGWSDGLFLSGFAQLDVAANGNPVQFIGPGGAVIGNFGKLNEQNLLFLDLAVGYWLYRDPDAPRLTGLAVISEVHYTTSVQDADVLIGGGNIPGASATATIGNPDNRFDVVNGTIGVQALLFDTSSLRVAGVFPLGSRDDQRFFDSEVQVQFNRRF